MLIRNFFTLSSRCAKQFLFALSSLCCLLPVFAMGRFDDIFATKKNEQNLNKKPSKPEYLYCFEKGYPQIQFESTWDEEQNDYLISLLIPKNDGSKFTVELYWCDSRMLPKDKISLKDSFRPLLYKMPKEVPDPEQFSEEQIRQIKLFTSKENRKNGPVDPPFFHDAVFNVGDQILTESHITKVNIFDGWSVNVHEYLKEPLKKVTSRIEALPKDEEITSFLKSLNRTDGFNWRTVRDREARSYHSIGLAIDILPRGYYQRIIYWGWQKQIDGENWWKTPLKKRWSPPQRVIDIFREEGFIWGGLWIVWDNMHFEYHPELIIYNE